MKAMATGQRGIWFWETEPISSRTSCLVDNPVGICLNCVCHLMCHDAISTKHRSSILVSKGY